MFWALGQWGLGGLGSSGWVELELEDEDEPDEVFLRVLLPTGVACFSGVVGGPLRSTCVRCMCVLARERKQLGTNVAANASCSPPSPQTSSGSCGWGMCACVRAVRAQKNTPLQGSWALPRASPGLRPPPLRFELSVETKLAGSIFPVASSSFRIKAAKNARASWMMQKGSAGR